MGFFLKSDENLDREKWGGDGEYFAFKALKKNKSIRMTKADGDGDV